MNIEEIKRIVLEFKQRTNFGGDRSYEEYNPLMPGWNAESHMEIVLK